MNYVTRAVEEVFRWVLQTSWQAAVLAGLIFAVQWLLRKRLSAAWRYGLWLLLVARLLMPATPQSALSVFNLIRSRPQPPLATHSYANTQSNPYFDVNAFNGTPSANAHAGPIETQPFPAPPNVVVKPTLKVDWFEVAVCGWLAGVCFFGVRLVWANARFRSRIAGCQSVADEEVMRVFNECRAALNIAQPIHVIESEEVETPAVYGLWRKWLLLPDGVFERFGEADLRCIFLHELAHIKRGDLGMNWLVSVLQLAHWFNPVLRLAFGRMRADREMAADALALAHVGKAENVAYGETILKVVENLTRDSAQPGLVGIAESKAGLAQRVRAIAQFSARRHWKWAALAAAIVVAGIGLTDARQTTAPVIPPSTSTTKTKPVREITGVIVDPDGNPVDGAQAAVMIHKIRPQIAGGEHMSDSDLSLSGQPRLFNPSSGHLMGEKRDVPWNYCVTGRDGRFDLDDLEGATFLMVTDKKGFARIASNEFSANMTVKLNEWGRIEGSVWDYSKTVADESVVIGPAKFEDQAWGQKVKFETNTDSRGRFTFDYVPPARFTVFSEGISQMFTVESGKTAAVKVGGDGRTVIGRMEFSDPKVKIDWASSFNNYFLFPEPVRPSEPFKSDEEYLAWMSQPEVRAWKSKRDVFAYQVKCSTNGSFRVDQVEPGHYAMGIGLRAQNDPHGAMYIQLPEEFNRTFEIPSGKSNENEPLDLGVIKISDLPIKRYFNPGTDARQETVKPVDSKAVSTDKTKPLREITGLIVDPDGRPASGAQVALMIRKSRPQMTGEYMTDSDLSLSGQPRLFNPSSGHRMGEARNEPWNYCTTEKDGRFHLDDLEGATFLLVADEKGFVRIATNQFSANMTVKLEPWGRIDGVVMHYKDAVANESVSIGLSELGGLAWGQIVRFETNTDSHGRFFFDYVPSGQFSTFAYGRSQRFTVEEGKTTTLRIGGKGRTVVGRFEFNDPKLKIEWSSQLNNYFLFPEAVRPRVSMSEEELLAWGNQPEVRDYFFKRDVFAYQVKCLQDGSFRVDQVEPGNYAWGIGLHVQNDPHAALATRLPDEFNQTFEIPAGKSNVSDPVDLGLITISNLPVEQYFNPGIDARQETVKPVDSKAVSAGKTKPLREIAGVIVDPDGHPASGAQVGLMIRKSRPQMTGEYMTDSDLSLSGQPRLFNPSSGHRMGEARNEPWNYCTTEKDGRFHLDDLEGATFLLVADEKGFVRIATNQFSANMTVKLEPWGRIDGTVWHYDKVVSNEWVFANLTDMHDGAAEHFRFGTNTDRMGRFVFDYVPPGRFAIGATGILKRFTVESGRTTKLNLGGNGRAVIGRLKFSDPSVQVDWDSIHIFGELIPEPQRPSKPFNSAYDFRAWRSRSDVRDWMSKREVMAYDVRYAPDGSFRIDQVEPGNYFLTVHIYDPSDTGHSKFDRQAWWFNRNFYIPASQPNDDKPFDLGPIELKFF